MIRILPGVLHIETRPGKMYIYADYLVPWCFIGQIDPDYAIVKNMDLYYTPKFRRAPPWLS